MFHPVSQNIMAPTDMAAMNRGQAGGASFDRNASAGGPDAVKGPDKGPMVQISPGSSSGCLMCVGMKSGMIPVEKLEALKSEMFSKIMAHEQAHASAAGSYGGPIHIDYDSNGIAVGGHVPIMIPGLSKLNPEESLKAFEQILAAALAPGDPSGQDMAVASRAQDLMGRAQVMMDAKQQREVKLASSVSAGQKSQNGLAQNPQGLPQNTVQPNPANPQNQRQPLLPSFSLSA